MTSSLRQKLDALQPQMLRVKGEAVPQLSGDDWKALIGKAVERALDRSGLTKQEVAYAMGYSDSGVIGRWISGQESPQLARLWAVESMRQPLAIELAAMAGADIHVHVEFRRMA